MPVYYPNMAVGDATFGHGFWWVEHPKNASFRAKIGQNMGKHDMKYGFEYRRSFGYISYPSPWTFNFGSALTADTFIQPNTALSGSPYATFLLGALGSDSGAVHFAAPAARQQLRRILPGRHQADPAPHAEPRPAVRILGRHHGCEQPDFPLSRPDQSRFRKCRRHRRRIPSAVTAIANIPYQWNGAWYFADEQQPGGFPDQQAGLHAARRPGIQGERQDCAAGRLCPLRDSGRDDPAIPVVHSRSTATPRAPPWLLHCREFRADN